MAFRPNSILMNRGQTVVPSQSHSTQWIDYKTNIKKPQKLFENKQSTNKLFAPSFKDYEFKR